MSWEFAHVYMAVGGSQANGFGRHDFVGAGILEYAILVNALRPTKAQSLHTGVLQGDPSCSPLPVR